VIKAPIHISPRVLCPHCGDSFTISDQYITWHFEGRAVKCGNCTKELDWWETARRAIEDNFMLNMAFAFIGARETVFVVRMKPDERLIFRFSDHGVPAGSKLLHVNYTPNGPGLFPGELCGNLPMRRIMRDEVVIFPIPFPGEAPKETPLAVLVSWVPASSADDSLQSLVDAFEAYAADRFPAMVVPANVAVESEMSRVVAGYIERFASAKRVSNLLKVATYWHQLHALMPMMAAVSGIRNMPDPVRKALDDLIELRNQLAHSGTLEKELDKPAAATLLCGALFGFHYVRYVDGRLPKQAG
jgi:predicted Zn finger-like uncharacterized protein